jgi:GNAT superfamily N-acetyltransferase
MRLAACLSRRLHELELRRCELQGQNGMADAALLGVAIVRVARPDEMDMVGELTFRSYVPLYNQRKGFTEAKFAASHYGRELRFPLERQKQPDVFAVAVLSGKIVGAVDYHSHYQDGEPGFAKLAVEPTVRASGIGQMLVQWCVQRARHQGHRMLLLHTTSAMHAAQRVYTRIGFVRQPLEADKLLRPLFLFQLDLTTSPTALLSQSSERCGALSSILEPLEVLYRDKWYAVVNKPSGLMVHPSTESGTLSDFVIHRAAGTGEDLLIDRHRAAGAGLSGCIQSYHRSIERRTRRVLTVHHTFIPQVEEGVCAVLFTYACTLIHHCRTVCTLINHCCTVHLRHACMLTYPDLTSHLCCTMLEYT